MIRTSERRSPTRRVRALPLLVALAIGVALLPASASGVVLSYVANCDGAQETPPNASPGTGTGTFTIDTDANTVSYNIQFSGLIAPESNAHIHGFAPPGTPAGVKHQLPLGSPKIGVWNYVESDESGIVGGQTYVNIHSTAFPGGEIRGQIIPGPTATDPSTWGKVKSLFQ